MGLAARNAAETMGEASSQVATTTAEACTDIPILRHDVLKQATASLAMAIGCVQYSESVHVATQVAEASIPAAAEPTDLLTEPEAMGVAQLFSTQQMTRAVRHANEVCTQYGVRIISINVISAFPSDPRLTEALSAGAVAAAAAEQAETAARGNAKAQIIAAQSTAEAISIQANADANAERIRAAGAADAARSLENSSVAVELARLSAAGKVIGDGTSFFFGEGAQQIPAMLSNPALVKDRKSK